MKYSDLQTLISAGSVRTPMIVVSNSSDSSVELSGNIITIYYDGKSIQLNPTYISGNDCYATFKDITINDSWYSGWTVTQCLKDLYNRVSALEG